MRRLRSILPLLLITPALLLWAAPTCGCSEGPRIPETKAVGNDDCYSKPSKRDKAKKAKTKGNEFKQFATRDEAVKAAKKEANDYAPRRAQYRGPCRRGGHVHVDIFNKKRTRILKTIHYEWPGHTKEGC